MNITISKKTIGKLKIKDFDARKAAQVAKLKIYQRTKAGKDVGGQPFKPYSAEYKQWKSKKYPGSASRVNLTLTGKMLQNMTVKSGTKEQAVLGFTGKQAVKAGKNNVTRHFWGLTKAEFINILKKIFK